MHFSSILKSFYAYIFNPVSLTSIGIYSITPYAWNGSFLILAILMISPFIICFGFKLAKFTTIESLYLFEITLLHCCFTTLLSASIKYEDIVIMILSIFGHLFFLYLYTMLFESRIRIEEIILPRVSRTENINTVLNDNSCSICLADYDDNSHVVMLVCNHVFHEECIRRWSRIKNECPLCREEIV